jgi:Fic family protein
MLRNLHEYYRHFENARKKRDLTDFLLYAVLGLRDGLRDSLRIAQKSVLKITWEHLVYAIFRSEKGSNKVLDRRRDLALAMKPYETYTRDELLYKTPKLSKQYATRERLGSRDLNELVKMGLIESDGKSYKLNTSRLLYVRFPEVREGI